MADMVQVQDQSRKSFFQWHVLLMLKKKELQKTLHAAGLSPDIVNQIEAEQPPVVDSDELALLQWLALPIPDNLTPYDLPKRESVAGIRFFFRAAPAFDNEHDFVLDFIRQQVDGTYQHAELMRVAYDNRVYLRKASAKFNQALQGYSTHMVVNAAKVWSRFHGAVVLPWQPISARLLIVDSREDRTDGGLHLSDPDALPDDKKQPRINLSGRKTLFGDQ